MLSACAGPETTPGSSDDQPDVIDLNVAYGNAAANYLNLYVAWNEGFFERNGLNVGQPFNAQQVGAVDVLLSGDADVIVEGGPQVLTAVARGADLRIFGSTVNKYTFVVVGPKNLQGIDSLAGKKLGVSAPGGSVSRAAAVMLDQFGLTGKVELQHIADLATRLAALQQGQVDAILISPPVGQITSTGDFHTIYDLSDDMEFLLTSLATSGKFFDANPEALRRFIKSLYEAEQWIRDPANHDAVIDNLSKLSGNTDKASLEEGLEYQLKVGEPNFQFSETALQNSIDQVESAEDLTIDMDGVVDLDIMKEVLASFGVTDPVRG